MKTLARTSVIMATTLGLTATSIPAANAATTGTNLKPTGTQEEQLQLTQVEIDTVRELFTTYLTLNADGTFTINQQAIKTAGLDPTTFDKAANNLNTLKPTASQGTGTGAVTYSNFQDCVLEGAGLKLFIDGALWSAIASKNWPRAAWLVVRSVGARAVLGGVGGVAVSLATAAVWCSTPWGRH